MNYAEIRVRIELIFGLGLPSAAAGFFEAVWVRVRVCVCVNFTQFI